MVYTLEYVKLRIFALFGLNAKVCQVVRELSQEGIKNHAEHCRKVLQKVQR